MSVVQARQLLNRLKDGLATLYASRLCHLYLYGSYSRGEQIAGSDFDVLIVLKRIEGYAAEIAKTSELIASLSLEYGVSISRVFVNDSEWKNARTPFLDHVRTEAMAA